MKIDIIDVLPSIVTAALIAIVITILLSLPADALLNPDAYEMNQCELIAKDYQIIYGGSLILIQPLKDNGAYNLGPYNGHMINKAYSKERGVYYIDWETQSYFKNETEILEWYMWNTNKSATIFNMNEDRIPFPFIWHY